MALTCNIKILSIVPKWLETSKEHQNKRIDQSQTRSTFQLSTDGLICHAALMDKQGYESMSLNVGEIVLFCSVVI